MRATLCLLADFDAENYCRDFMVEASELNHVGVAAGSLPRHISLGFPYEITNWEEYMAYAEKLSKRLNPFCIVLSDMICTPIGESTGSFFFKFVESFGLDELREKVALELSSELGVDFKEEKKITGQRNITLGFGTAPYQNYRNYVESVDKERFIGKKLCFDQLGVFYYDSEKITATSFMCCRRYKLK